MEKNLYLIHLLFQVVLIFTVSLPIPLAGLIHGDIVLRRIGALIMQVGQALARQLQWSRHMLTTLYSKASLPSHL